MVSSVSPERCDTIGRQPARRASSMAAIVSVSVPIWLSLMRMAFAAALLDAASDPLGVGHEEVVADELDVSPSRSVSCRQPTQSSSARPSSSETIG